MTITIGNESDEYSVSNALYKERWIKTWLLPRHTNRCMVWTHRIMTPSGYKHDELECNSSDTLWTLKQHGQWTQDEWTYENYTAILWTFKYSMVIISRIPFMILKWRRYGPEVVEADSYVSSQGSSPRNGAFPWVLCYRSLRQVIYCVFV